jgi:hypothetical protein
VNFDELGILANPSMPRPFEPTVTNNAFDWPKPEEFCEVVAYTNFFM